MENNSRFQLSAQLLILFIFALVSTEALGQNNLLPRLMEPHQLLNRVLQNPEKHKVQILYTQIDRDQHNKPRFTSYTYRVDEEQYFYPASSIKIFACILALEKINDLSIEGLNKDCTLKFNPNTTDGISVNHDSVSLKNETSMALDIKKILVGSDNHSFNRLYEFLGQEGFNARLMAKGFEKTKIIHRLSIPMSPEENRHTPGFSMTDPISHKIIYREAAQFNPIDLGSTKPVFLGDSFIQNDSLIERPMSFRHKNVSSVRDLQNGIRKLLFPGETGAQEYDLSSEDLSFLYRYMSQLPRESNLPDYRDKPDNYCKFLMYGAEKDPEIPDHIRIFNKIGLAYGFTIDNAYIVDFKHKVEFLLTAVIYTNENKTLNDGKYEYDSIAFPFFQKLGEVIYDYELKRKKEFDPNLERFNLDYSN